MLKRIAASIAYRLRATGKRLAGRRTEFMISAEASESKYRRFVRDLDRVVGGLEGKRLLEVGSDPNGHFLMDAIAYGRVASATGVNPAVTEEQRSAQLTLLNGDARSMPFASEAFDVIASMSVFEHVRGLDEVLHECYRVLAPGGLLVAEFAPIWSACWGHHLWLYHGGKVVDWNSHPLPPYAHLLMTEEELTKWCDESFGDAELSRKIVEFVFHSSEQNRLFYSDYVALMEQSLFEVVVICGFADVPHPASTPACDYPAIFARLREQYPDKGGFGNHGMLAILRRPADEPGLGN